ncbi:sulfatase [Aestuariivivens sediminicola]|uniref:sulfatase n=1 Tax=Aestuariivivens sediminicola TaxID=2913560 RepID=UPI001F5951BD|nr:sulfatase [Aestuariivivens sediminicola]
MKHTILILISVLYILLYLLLTPKVTGQSQPHVVLLFVDDWGWSDVGFRNDRFLTPHIDQLKRDGMEFTRAYIPTPTCSPSRASLLTGKEAIRLEMPRHIEQKNKDGTNDEKYNYWKTDPAQMPSINWLPLEEQTYAEVLKEQGYYNMFIGKWHLGHEPYYPIYQGFDAMFGTGNWGHPKSYYPDFFKDDLLEDYSDAYLTDVLTDKAVQFISDYDKDVPFMMSLWYYNVHSPHVGRKDLVEQFLEKGYSDKEATYAAMVASMDASVGRVRTALKDKGIDKNTVVLLISDQGGFFSNAPLSGGKIGGNTLGEGGARVPFLVYYPGVTTPGSVSDTPIQTIDVFPTLAEIASGNRYNSDDIQGVSLMPELKGKKLNSRDLFFYRSYEDQYAAILSGAWKLIKYRSGTYELFNVADDISEHTNQIGTGLPIEKTLKNKLKKWETRAVPTYE